MGMIILLFYVIPYMAVSAIVMVITVKYTNKIWIRGIVAAALFLIPTYDIIITNILGVYYSWSVLLRYHSKGFYKGDGRVSAEYLF